MCVKNVGKDLDPYNTSITAWNFNNL